MQRGALAHRVQADFGRALLIAPGETGLRDMPVRVASRPDMEIEEVIDLRDDAGGLADAGDYRLTTTYRGPQADNMRRRFANDSADSIGQGYEELVAVYYPGARQMAVPQFEDDPDANEVRVEEHYLLPDLWGKRQDEKSGTQADVWLSEIDRALALPKSVERRGAWLIGSPQHIRQRLEVRLDGGWPKENKRLAVENAYFQFQGRLNNDGRTLVLDGVLRTLTREVPAPDVAAYRRDLMQLSDEVSYGLLLSETNAFAWKSVFDLRLVPVLAAIFILWVWVVCCGVSRSVSPFVGMLFRPRATVRAALDARRSGTAFALLVMAGAFSALIEDRVLEAAAQGESGSAFVFSLAAVFGTVIGALLYAALYAWFGRLLGGVGRSNEVVIALGWVQVPVLALVPIYGLMLLLYGTGVVIDPQGLTMPPALLTALLASFPMVAWALVLLVAGLAEVHRLSLGRALLLAVLPVLVAIALAIPVWFLLR
jgi:hypothetical protein